MFRKLPDQMLRDSRLPTGMPLNPSVLTAVAGEDSMSSMDLDGQSATLPSEEPDQDSPATASVVRVP